jgi:LemA protein
MKFRIRIRLLVTAALVALQVTSQFVFAQKKPEPLTKDETYFALARRNLEQNESPVTNVVGVLDEIIEVGEISVGADGKTTAVVKEKAPSSAAFQQKAIKVTFIVAGDKWRWDSFEDRGKFYPVEKLFPVAKGELGRHRQAVEMAWARVLETMNKQGEAAMKVLETAKAIIKAEPTAMVPVASARKSLAEAVARAKESGDMEPVRSAFRELTMAVEPVATLGEQFPDLKANDAWLRLHEEFSAVQKSLPTVRKNYLDAVAAYNEILKRLPYGLVAYGLGFVKLETQIEAE